MRLIKKKYFIMFKFNTLLIIFILFFNIYSFAGIEKKLPANAFIKNEGQIASLETNTPVKDVLYYVSTPNAKLYIRKTGLSYLFTKNEYEVTDKEDIPKLKMTHWQRVDVNFDNANLSEGIELEAVPWHYNFFYAHCPDGIMNVKAFTSLLFKNIYKGIDFKIYFDENSRLKYDFIVAPNADPSQIKLNYEFSNPLKINDNGQAIADNTLGQIIENKPIGFQNGNEIDIRWELLSNNTLIFNIGDYDHKQTLIIDPFLLWSTYFGGNGDDIIYKTVANGSLLVISGTTTSTNFPTLNPGGLSYYQGTCSGNMDMFIASFDDNGILQWCTYYGGTVNDNKAKCFILNNAIYVSGQTYSTDIPTMDPGGGAYYQGLLNGDGDSHGGTPDGFILKFSLSGVRLWATYFGKEFADEVVGLAATSTGLFAHIVTYSNNIPLVNPGGGAYQETVSTNNEHVYFARFNLVNHQQTWGTYFGADGTGGSWSQIVCDANSFYAPINTSNSSAPTLQMGSAYYDDTHNGGADVLILKFNDNGVLLWSTFFGGNSTDDIRTSTIANNKLWIGGHTYSSASTFPLYNPGNGAYYQSTINGYDGFIASFDITTGQLLWSTFYGGNNTDYIRDIKGDAYGIYITGYTASSNFPIYNPGTPTFYVSSNKNVFIGKFKQNGKRQWVTYFSYSSGTNEGLSLSITNNSIYLTGFGNNSLLTQSYGSAYFQPSFGGGLRDGFIAKFDKCVIPNESLTVSSPAICNFDSTWIIGNGEDVVSYLWNTADTVDSIHVAPHISTTYSLTITDDMTCQNTDSITVTVYPLPNVQIAGEHPICLGDSVELYANGAQTYLWLHDSTTVDSIMVSPSTSLTYYVLGTDTNQCKNIDSAQVVVYPLPNVTITGEHPICFGDSIKLYGNGAQTYFWMPDSLISDSIHISPPITTTFYLLGTDIHNCKNIDSANVVVYPLPNVQILGAHPICLGDYIDLTAMNAEHYVWNTTDTTSNIHVNPSQTFDFIVVGTDTNGCINSDTSQVVVNPLPPVKILGVHPICHYDSISISAYGANTYTWSPWGGHDTSITVSPDSTTFITLVGVDANGCVNSDTDTLIVYPLPLVTVLGDHPICFGDSVTVSAHGAYIYNWSPLNITADSITIAPEATTSYTVIGTDIHQCKDTTNFSITVFELPVAQITGINRICQQEEVSLQASGGDSYLWNTNETSANILVQPMQTTTYSVIAIKNICSDTAYFTLSVDPKPSITLTSDTTIIIGMTLPLHVSGANTYIWTPVDYLSCTSCSNPTTRPSETIEYCVEGVNTYGCSDTACVVVTVDKECGETFVPSAFSPNGDGNNDVLYVRGKCIKSMSFSIYNRWGEKVFESSDSDNGWDGTFRGKALDTGVFVYVLKAEYYNGVIINQKGNITLVR